MAAPTSSTAEEKSLEVPINALGRIYWAVVSGSTSNEAAWRQLCDGRLSAECTACKIRISGPELRLLATQAEGESADENPTLDRLRRNYCGRNTCEGRFYRVNIVPDSERHWTMIKDQLQSTTPEIRETRPPKNSKSIFSGVGMPRIRPLPLTILLLVGVVL
ncbi:MAG: hypothetical protein ACXW32_08805, partial [Limisphaerales bacterium]